MFKISECSQTKKKVNVFGNYKNQIQFVVFNFSNERPANNGVARKY